MKKRIGLAVFLTMIMSTGSFAETYYDDTYADEPKTVSSKETYLAALYANNSEVEARFDYEHDFEPCSLIAGIGGIWHKNGDDYNIYDLKAGMESEALTTGLKFALGVKGLLGDTKENSLDGDLLALGFLVSARYNISGTLTPIPIEVYINACMVPEPLCLQDSESYRDFNTGIDFYIIERAAVVVRYRYIRICFDESVNNSRFSDEIVSLGFKLMF